MSDCPNHVLSKCLSPQPLTAPYGESLAKSVLRPVLNTGKEIVLGSAVDSFWSIANTPNHIFKYIAGVDKELGHGNSWSWENIAKHNSLKTVDANPIFRTLDIPLYAALGILNTVTGAIPHKICDNRLALCAKYFAAPPKDVRQSAHWVVMGVLGLAAFSTPVLAARGAVAPVQVAKAASTKIASTQPSALAGMKPSFAASVSQIGESTNGVQVPPALLPEAFRSPRLPKVIVPEEPVVVKPVAPKTSPAPTPELPPSLSRPLPQIFEPHQVAAPLTSAAEVLENALWTFHRGMKKTLEIFEQEKLPAQILQEDKIYHAKLERGLQPSKKVQEALERVKQRRLEKEKSANLKK